MCLTAEGGFIVAGFSESQEGDVQGHHGVYDTWIVKLSSSGNVEWIERCMGGEGIDTPASIDQTDDGGFIVAGFSDSQLGDVTGNHGFSFDCWVVRLAPASGTEILNGIDDDCDGTIDGIIDSAPLVEQVESPIFVYPNPTNGIVTIAEFSSPKQSIIIRVLHF